MAGIICYNPGLPSLWEPRRGRSHGGGSGLVFCRLDDSPICDGGFRLPSLLFKPKQPQLADGTKTDRMCHGGASGLSWER
ncbi:hypothetical protein BGLA2_1060013 [Burkholderia gladioli]|nr:hypothetical protein BGLA2_1060013 [Burkholderia gladioli]